MVVCRMENYGSVIDPFSGKEVDVASFTMTNDMGMSVQLITRGATITSIKVPDARGNVDDVVLGYENIAGYETTTNPYFGATVGRVCNRVANGRFQLPNGRAVEVTRNLGDKHQLHGGRIGFDKAVWTIDELHADGVTLQHRSPAGHEGYPGEVTARVRYALTEDNCLHVRMEAETTEQTAVNLTNHSYFNLAGHDTGKAAIDAHQIMIKASSLTETDAESIPTGQLTALQGTAYDFRAPANLGERLRSLLPANGFDDNYCVELQNNGITMIAKVSHADSGRWLEIASNQPGVQFYTSNFLPDVEKGAAPLIGKGNAKYAKHGAFCLETQKYPDAVNHPNFPSIILNPGEKYSHEVIYKFGVCRGAGGCR